ncbi:hypothetical protein ACQR1W_17580 [Bradyrhizobium sp. HKCCYLS1011]|uniref:hypothetical protein n=1 Tax=Bradyrhizobium sp. HKCCYLS1011 TaxID=3420733 RepID=UPI003EBCED32
MMLGAKEMLAKAEQCEDAADRVDPICARFYRNAAQQWRDMAAQLELLEREQVYRIIRVSLSSGGGTK